MTKLRKHKNLATVIKKVFPYLFVIILVAISAAALFPFRNQLNSTTIALIFLIPVLICTTWWGFAPGIISAILTFLLYNFIFLTPYYSFSVHDSQNIIALGIFLVIAILISQLVGRSKKNLDVAIAREQELVHLYELSFSLTGIMNPKDVAEVLANNIAETIQPSLVEIKVNAKQDEPEFKVTVGEADMPSTPLFPSTFPLQTSRGLIGEVTLSKRDAPPTSTEERLMQAFSAQGSLAFERAFLSQEENKNKVLLESDRMKSVLLSSVSHELRTPLATIKAFVTSLLSEQVSWDTTERIELLNAMNDETDHLNHLVGNLLDMSRIEAGALKPERKWNLLSEIVEVAAKRMHNNLNDNKVVVDIPDDEPLVPVDYMQMEQVFTNLLSNSAKYSPQGSIIRIKTETHQDENELLVMMINKSPHVPKEHLDQIFTKFYRVTNSDRVTGTGLGLSICKGIIEAHGGQIWAENLLDGFVFKFTLPLQVEGMAPPILDPEIL